MSTLLQLVNRARGKIRQDELTALSTTEPDHIVMVSLINEAKRDVLELEDWNFDIRHDGVVKIIGQQSYTTGVVVADATTILIVGESDRSDFSGDKVARLIVTEDANYSRTSFIATDISDTAGSDLYTLNIAFPGTTNATSDVRVFCSEYLLPVTVRDVLSFRDEQNTITPIFIDKLTQLDPSVPNPHLESSSQVDSIYVGGWYTETTLAGATADAARLGFMVHPIPSATKLLHYSYRYRHPALSVATDTLNVPAHVEDIIVDRAVQKAQMSSIANDPTLASLNGRDVERRTKESVSHTRPDPNRRRAIRSHEYTGRRVIGHRPSDPTQFGST